ncbi:MAG: hypothetical protein WCJ09_23430 [Planctomycetota bacterium]
MSPDRSSPVGLRDPADSPVDDELITSIFGLFCYQFPNAFSAHSRESDTSVDHLNRQFVPVAAALADWCSIDGLKTHDGWSRLK